MVKRRWWRVKSSCLEVKMYSILSEYPAILDIATYVSLNKLFGFHGKKKLGMRPMRGDDDVV